MSSPTRQAILSPLDKTAGWLSHDFRIVTLIAPQSFCGMKVPGGNYVSRFSTSTIVTAGSDDERLRPLDQATEFSLALDFAMLLFDSELTIATRSKIASELNEMLAFEDCESYVLDILLAAPLDASVDIDTTTRLVADNGTVSSFVKRVADCQPRVRWIRSTWIGMRKDPMVKQCGYDEVTLVLVDAGVFRRLAIEVQTQADLEAVRAQLLFDSALASRLDARILTAFFAQFRSKLPVGKRRPRFASGTSASVTGGIGSRGRRISVNGGE